MPDPHKLAVLAELRRANGLTLAQMAVACGLEGRKGREAASAWEQGQSVPRSHRRKHFIDYLSYTLGLHRDPARFQALWRILAEEWGWGLLHEAEWREHFPNMPEVYRSSGFAGSAEGTELLLHIQSELAVLRSRLKQLPDIYQRALGAEHPLPAAELDRRELLDLAEMHLQSAIMLLGRVLNGGA